MRHLHLPIRMLLLSPIVLFQALSGAADTRKPAPFVEVSARKVIDFGNHTATYVRVRPPVLPKVPPPAPPAPLSEAERARLDELSEKNHVTLNVSATVYLLAGSRVVTELRWRDDETGELTYRAYSNADFRYLTQLCNLETETTVYLWFPFVEVCDLNDWPVDQSYPLPSDIDLSPTESEYLVDARVNDRADQKLTLAGLDFLHAYYQLHHAELKADHERRVAESARREQELRENPPKQANTVLRFWPKTFPQR